MYNPSERRAWSFFWKIKAAAALEDLGIDTTEAEVMYSAPEALRVDAGNNWMNATGSVASQTGSYKFVRLRIERKREHLRLVVHRVSELSQVQFDDYKRRVTNQ